MPAITDMTGIPAQFLPAPISAFQFLATVNYSYQGVILDTVPANINFIDNQIANDDEDRILFNTASVSYLLQTQRFTFGQTNTIYQVPLRSYIKQVNLQILNGNHIFKVSLTIDLLANIIYVGGLVGSPIMTINSITLLVKMQKVDVPTIIYKLSQLGGLDEYQDIFARSLMQHFTALSDATNAIINLPNFINSNINFVYFAILLINALVPSIRFDYVNYIVSFHLTMVGVYVVGHQYYQISVYTQSYKY